MADETQPAETAPPVIQDGRAVKTKGWVAPKGGRGAPLPTTGPLLGDAARRKKAAEQAKAGKSRAKTYETTYAEVRARKRRVTAGGAVWPGRDGHPKRAGKIKAVETGMVMGMTAAGVPIVRIAEALQVHPDSVTQALNREPDSREKIATLRAALKEMKMVKAHALEGKLWARAEKEVDAGEARDVDAIFRAVLASEKVQAAAAGEGNASGAPGGGQMGGTPAVALNILIQHLLEP